MFPTVIIVGGIIILIMLVFAATKPDAFRVERSAMLNASANEVFALIEDFRKWESWSPWERIDPGIRRKFSGSKKGEWAVYEWEGNNRVGTGRMEIVRSVPTTKLVIQLDFLKPFKAHNVTEFLLVPNEGLTRVTWAMSGPSSYFSKLMSMFFDVDHMIGKNFEEGLANMKLEVESKNA